MAPFCPTMKEAQMSAGRSRPCDTQAAGNYVGANARSSRGTVEPPNR